MNDPRAIEVDVEVAADPATTFRAFTEEMGEWWVKGPINFMSASRTLRKHCEPGVGGRILEVYEDGEPLEVARITVWEPGERVGWTSSSDGVEIEVRFLATSGGTRVVVQARVPEGATSGAGLSWLRVTPGWFGAWMERRDAPSTPPEELSRLAVVVKYDEPARAARWIQDVLGLRSDLPLPAEDLPADQTWIEFRIGNGMLVLWKREEPSSGEPDGSHVPMIFVDDLDAHYAHARAAGGKIVSEIHEHGFRSYEVEDPAGHRWSVVQAMASVHRRSAA